MQNIHFEGCINQSNILDCLYNTIKLNGEFNGMDKEKFYCFKCMTSKPISEFHKDKSKKRGHRDICKDCVSEYQRKYRSENADLIREKKRWEYLNNRERYVEKATLWNKTNHKKRKVISSKSAKKIYHERLKHDKEYMADAKKRANEHYKNNKKSHQESCNKRAKVRRDTDPEYQAACSARNMLGALKRYLGKRPPGRTHKILGYSAKKLQRHLESKFLPGMSWENRNEWHIDHIKPMSTFIAEGVTDPAIINALDNLQPLWAKDNQAKGNDYVAF